MRYFLDTEFLDDGSTIELISIGIVAEDGREYYAINEETDWARVVADDWLRANVLPHLPVIVTPFDGAMLHRVDRQPSEYWALRVDIRDAVLALVGYDPKPEFWGYYADYDWVVFCQLFGRMIDLPKGFPKFCRDLKQWTVDLGNPTLPKQESGEHNALADARWNRDIHHFLQMIAAGA